MKYNVLAWAGVHGNEQEPGIPLVASLGSRPIGGVEGKIAHPEAVAQGVRYFDEDLAVCIQQPERYRGAREAKLVSGILRACQQARLVIDLHEQGYVKKDYAYVGPIVDSQVFGFIALTGIEAVIVSRFGIQGRCSNTTGMDIHPESERNNTEYWRDILRAAREPLSMPDLDDITFLAHAGLFEHTRRKLGLIGRRIHPMEELEGVAELIGHTNPVRALYGCDADYSDGIEVVASLNSADVRVEGDLVYVSPLNDESF